MLHQLSGIVHKEHQDSAVVYIVASGLCICHTQIAEEVVLVLLLAVWQPWTAI